MGGWSPGRGDRDAVFATEVRRVRVVQPGDWPATMTPRRWPLPDTDARGLLWSVEVATERAPRLCPVFDALILADGRGGAWSVESSQPTGPDLAPWARTALPRGAFRPSLGSDPIFIADGGDVFRWGRDLRLRRI